jgi:hypothetical protein
MNRVAARVRRRDLEALDLGFGEFDGPVEEDPDADGADEEDHADDAPDHRRAGRRVPGRGVVRPLVREAVVALRTVGVGDPGGPEREVGELPGLPLGPDEPGRDAAVGGAAVIAFDVHFPDPLVGVHLRRGVPDRPRSGLVGLVEVVADEAVYATPLGGAEVGVGRIVAFLGVVLPHELDLQVERVGSVVDPEVGAVPEDRAVVHQAVLLERDLPGPNLRLGRDRLPVGTDHLLRDRGDLLGGVVRADAHDDQVDDEHCHEGLGDRPSADLHTNPRDSSSTSF